MNNKTAVACRLFVLVAAAAVATARSQPVDVAAIEKVVARTMEQHHLVGLSVGVMHHGRVVLAKGYGVASLANRDAVTPDTLFGVGSVTKQFVCVLALQLAQEGRLSMDDPVAKYFPQARRGSEITLRDLGNHVSGYRDYYPLDFPSRVMKAPRAASRIIEDHAIHVDFTPGSRYSYSNTGYLMLGEVVAQADGSPFENVLRRRVLEPLGMKHTAYEVVPGAPGIATGHGSFMAGDMAPVGLEAKGWLGAAGGIFSTPGDLLLWDLALMEGRLLSVPMQRELITPRTLADGRTTHYGCGLAIGEREGMPAWAHGGAIAGFSARNVMIPGSRSAIVLMTNVENMAGVLFDLYAAIARVLAPPLPNPPVVAGPPALSVAAVLMDQMQAGSPDRSRLGEEFNAFLTPERVDAAAQSLGKLGKPKSIEVTSINERGTLEHAVVLFKFESASAEAQMYRSADGLVQQFLVKRK